jgi:lipopolysaccharide transport system ATP-binding protein
LQKMSDANFVVQARGVRKEFSRAGAYRTLFRVLKGSLSPSARGATYSALHDINLEIRRGDKIGLIGNNGAGKSSLLRLIAGLYLPTGGEITVNGQVTLLAALGMGMVDDLDVEENIFLYGAICGLERRIIRANLGEIIEWAELQEFAGTKLKNLSTGMRARLAFSTTRHITTDITLMDEVLTAGDRTFKEKCESVFDTYKDSDRTFVFATHDIEFVRKICNRTLWLDKGDQKGFGDTEWVLQQYLASTSEKAAHSDAVGCASSSDKKETTFVCDSKANP